jgi:hypothetical protein
MLQPANGLFPGLLIGSVGFIAGFDGIGFHVFFAAAFSILLFIATAYFFRHAGLNRAEAWPAAAIAVMLICFASTQSLRLLLFCPACHAGVVPVGLFVFGLVVQYIERGKPAIRWPSMLVLLSTFSDMLTVLQVVLPIVAGMIILSWQQPQLRHKTYVVSLGVSLGALAGVGLYSTVGLTGIVDHGALPLFLTSIPAAAKTYVHTFRELTSILGTVYAGSAVLGLAVGIVITIGAILSRNIDKELPLALITSSALAGLLGPILSGTYWTAALFRYQLSFYTMPIIILVWLLCRILPNRAWIFTSAAATLAAVVIAKNTASARQRPMALNPSFDEVTQALARLPADLTLAEYWSAKPIYIESGRQLMVCPIVAQGFMFVWIANYGWCTEGLDRWARHHNWLVIDVDDLIDRSAIVLTYGVPDRKLELQNHQLWLYSWSPERHANLWRIICRPVRSFTPTPPC